MIGHLILARLVTFVFLFDSLECGRIPPDVSGEVDKARLGSLSKLDGVVGHAAAYMHGGVKVLKDDHSDSEKINAPSSSSQDVNNNNASEDANKMNSSGSEAAPDVEKRSLSNLGDKIKVNVKKMVEEALDFNLKDPFGNEWDPHADNTLDFGDFHAQLCDEIRGQLKNGLDDLKNLKGLGRDLGFDLTTKGKILMLPRPGKFEWIANNLVLKDDQIWDVVGSRFDNNMLHHFIKLTRQTASGKVRVLTDSLGNLAGLANSNGIRVYDDDHKLGRFSSGGSVIVDGKGMVVSGDGEKVILDDNGLHVINRGGEISEDEVVVDGAEDGGSSVVGKTSMAATLKVSLPQLITLFALTSPLIGAPFI